jgi:hypothetical protein
MRKFLFNSLSIYKWKIPFPVFLWMILAIVGALAEILRGTDAINNFLIFKGVFWHSVQQTNLYAQYPAEYFDNNHYGPSFSILIAPFAWMNVFIGCFLWCVANAIILLYAVKQLPISTQKKHVILLIGAIEMMTSIQNVQFNPMLTAWIMLSYVLVQKEKDFWATLFIAAGFLVKLYGIVGLAFFFFSNHKIKFTLSFIFWLLVLFALPMIYATPNFIVQSYKDWFNILAVKNNKNALATANNYMQDISVLGMIRRIGNIQNLKNLYILIPAALLYLLPFLRWKQFKFTTFQLSYLALALIGVVIFSTSAESATFVIAVMGVGIWYVVQQQKTVWINIVLGFVLLLTSLSATDLVPEYIRMDFVRPYSLKALPCFIVWLILGYQLLKKDFSLVNTQYA